MFTKSLFAACAATVALGFAGVANADELDNATSIGTFSTDSSQFVSIDVEISRYLSANAAQPAQIKGVVNITGYSGALSMNVGAAVKNVTFDTVVVNGVSYPRAHLVTKQFWFTDLKGGARTLATAEADVVKYGARGTICAKVINAKTGATIVMTCDASGNLINLPLSSGNTIFTTQHW